MCTFLFLSEVLWAMEQVHSGIWEFVFFLSVILNCPRGNGLSLQSTFTHWGRVTHICVGKITIIASDNGLSPERRQAIIWTNAGLLSIGTLRTYFSEILIKIQQFSLKKMHLKMSSAKRRLCCLGLNVLTARWNDVHESTRIAYKKAQ